MSENNTDVIPDQISRRRFLGAAGGFAATALVAPKLLMRPLTAGVLRSTSGTPLGEVPRRLTSTRQRGSLMRISPPVG